MPARGSLSCHSVFSFSIESIEACVRVCVCMSAIVAAFVRVFVFSVCNFSAKKTDE